jgi:hypothetical protein
MTPQQGVSNAVLLEKITNLQEDFNKMATAINCHLEAQIKFEQQSITQRTVLATRVDDHEKLITDLRIEINKLTKAVAPLIVTNRILSILGGVLMASVIALLWGILTNQVTLVFP